MKAKIGTRIIKEGRTRLEQVIPLKLPFVLFVDPASVCNFQCEFCANGDRELVKKTGRKQGVLDFELFKKLVDELKAYPGAIKALRLYKEGEPLLNPHFADMIRYAKDSGAFLSIDTTTNASLLNPELSLKIIDAGLDRINISIDGLSAKDYLRTAKVKLNFEELVENIRFFYEHRGKCEVFIKTIGNYLSEEERQKFYDIFGDISDIIAIENLMPCWSEYDLSDIISEFKIGVYGQPAHRVEVCPYLFYNITVNSDGSVSACFLDWEHKMLVGDLRESSFLDIWNGAPMNELRKLHLQKRRAEHPICKNCGQLVYGMADDVDDYADELLSKTGLG